MPNRDFSGKNFSYVINADHRFMSISEGMQEMYPRLKVGQVCHKAIYGLAEPCGVCPLNEPKDHEITVYNPVINKWVNVLCSDLPWPGQPSCSLIACSVIKDDNAAIMHRLPTMAGYDVFFEMNITKNAFRRFFRGMSASEVEYEEETLESLMSRTANNLVHPLDKDRFNEFWDMSTMMERLRESNGALHDEFVERNSHNGWDLVHSTVVPDSSLGTTDDIIVAMYTVIRSPQLAQLAIDSTEIDVEKLKAPERTTNLHALLSPAEFNKALQNQLQSSLQGSRCLMKFDVENFRFFNRWIGREQGDILLEEFATYLRQLDTDYNIIPAYLGADHFAFTLPLNRYLAQKVRDDLCGILAKAPGGLGFRLAIGATLADHDSGSPSDLLDEARTAARRSLESSSVNLTWFDKAIAQERESRVHTIAEINEGLASGQFIPHFQPKCNQSDKKIIGAEALARWNHPERGIISPALFVPVLESTGNIHKLDSQIWRQTFAAIRRWLDKGLSVPPISVNVSRYDIGAIDVVAELVELSEHYRVLPSLVEVEITENMLAENNERIRSVIDGLRANGFAVAIDDFGSGYSSLNMLKDIPADILKLDLKFLDINEGNESKGLAIIRSIIGMSQALGLPIVAEGVETQQQADLLLEMNCHYAQGWFYHKPASLEHFEKLLGDSESVMVEGIRKHYLTHSRKRIDLSQNEFDDAVLGSLKNPVVIYELNGEDINIVKFNDEFSRIIGAQELLRRRYSIQNFIHEQDLPKLYGAFQRMVESPSKITRCTLRFFTEGGDTVPFTITLSLITNENGLKHFLGFPIPSDSAERSLEGASQLEIINRRWLDDRCNADELPEEIIESVSGAVSYIFMKDDEVHMKACNKALLEVFGVSFEEVSSYVSRDMLTNIPPQEINMLLDSLHKAVSAEGRRIDVNCEFRRQRDGRYVPCKLGIHFVREIEGGYEFIASAVER